MLSLNEMSTWTELQLRGWYVEETFYEAEGGRKRRAPSAGHTPLCQRVHLLLFDESVSIKLEETA